MRNNCFKRLTLQPLQIYPKKTTFQNELTIHNKNDRQQVFNLSAAIGNIY